MADDADDAVSRLLDGRLDADSQRQLAADLGRDPALRRRLRSASRDRARLAAALRAPRPDLRLSRPILLTALLAACLALGLAAAIWLLPERPLAEVTGGTVVADAQPTRRIRADQPFTTTDHAELMVESRARLELEPGSSGSLRRDPGTTVRLDAGGALLRLPPDEAPLRLDAAAASITAAGEVAVRHLDVPAGDGPAIQVEVASGHARIEAADGAGELTAGQMRLLAPGGRVRARISRIDGPQARTTVSASGGDHRMRWHLDHDGPTEVLSARRRASLRELPPGTEVVVHLARDGRQVTRLEAPNQIVAGTLAEWDPRTRRLLVIRGRSEIREGFSADDDLVVDPALVGRRVRLDIDPLPPHPVRGIAADGQPPRTPARAWETPPAKDR